MDLDHDACCRALATRDARFDGRLFVGVKTTGIYCRPICPARTPKRENVIFFASAAGAQEAGFRPCLRCRPETAPDLGAWRGTSNTVSRALALIGDRYHNADYIRLSLNKVFGALSIPIDYTIDTGAAPRSSCASGSSRAARMRRVKGQRSFMAPERGSGRTPSSTPYPRARASSARTIAST